MKKILKYIYNLIKVLILCIPFVLDYFGRNKMGVHRFLIAKTYIIESKLIAFHVVELIKIVAILIFIFAVMYALMRRKKLNALLSSSLALIVILSMSRFIVAKVYYFYLLCFGLVTILCFIDVLKDIIIKNLEVKNEKV